MVVGALSSVTRVAEDVIQMKKMADLNYFSSSRRRDGPALSSPRLCFGIFEIDVARRELRRAGEIVHLEPQVFDLIAHLIQNRDRIVSKEELINAIWNGRIVSEAALNSRISAARRALGDSGNDQRLIRTTYKRGFRFVGEPSDPRVLPNTSRTSQQRALKAVVESWSPSTRPSIAVLPFENKSFNSDQEYVAEGLTVDIITALAQQHSFVVVARNSTFCYGKRALDIGAVANQPGVRYVLHGSVRRAVNRVRVTIQLIDAETGTHLWGEKYDRELADIFAVQDDITARVIGSVGVQISFAEAARTRKKAA